MPVTESIKSNRLNNKLAYKKYTPVKKRKKDD